MKTQIVLWIVWILIASCSQPAELPEKNNQIVFADSLSIFAPGIISTMHKERDLAISPDGNRMLFTKSAQNGAFSVIMETVKAGNNWSDPEVVAFSGNYSDLEPAYAPDGNTLYFASNRPVTGDQPKDFDIWKVGFDDGQWGTPQRLDAAVNTSGNEFYPSVSRSGNLYFTASPDFQRKKEDIFIARKVNGSYERAMLLSDSINTSYYEFNAFIDPDEEYIIFSSWGRPDGKGGGDLYLCEKDNDGKWQQARPLSINTNVLEYCPFVSPDKKYFFFTANHNDFRDFYQKGISADQFDIMLNSNRNGNGDIWILPFDEIISPD
ncbi:MAG: hypothetical protein WBA74_21685 [Cyclobacteriaceae bacterium]